MARRVAAVIVVLAALLGCSPQPVEVPAFLRGRWVTDDAAYDGRAILFGADSVAFDDGAEGSGPWPVTAIETDVGDELVLVYAGADDLEYRVPLLHEEGAGELRLAHRASVVWRRESP